MGDPSTPRAMYLGLSRSKSMELLHAVFDGMKEVDEYLKEVSVVVAVK